IEGYRFLYGGRLTYTPPVEGLMLMATVLAHRIEILTSGVPTGESGTEKNYVGSVNYVKHDVDLKAEYYYQNGTRPTVTKESSYYVQAGYTLFDTLTPFVRYDYISFDDSKKSDPSYYQKDIAVGIGYKINSYIAFKAENHSMNGFAIPVAATEGFDATTAKKNWNLSALSMNFIF
ncbi:MAG: hypothetical protein PH343_03285, partial [Nitrospira sp.]|nr:hypothetical protein [Nitrospira sp.]